MRGADPLPLRSASPTGIAATEAALRRSLEAKEGTERFYLTELRRAAVCYNGVLQTFEQAERLEGRAAHDSSERRSLSASRESTRRLYPFTDTGRPRLPLTNCGTRCSPSHRRSTGTGTAESAGCFNALRLPLRGSATSSLRSLSPMAPPLASSVSAVTPSCASSDASMLYFDDLVSRAKMLRRARREPPPQPPAECSAAPSRRPVEAAPTAAGRTNSCLLRAQQPQEQDSLPLSPASAAAAVMDAGRKSPAAGGRPAARPWHQQADREPTELSGSSAAAGRAEEAVAWPRDGNANEELYNGEHPATPRVVGGAERRDRAGETDPSRGVSKPAAPESSSASSGSRLEEAGVTERTRESPVRGDASVQSWRLRAGRWHCEPAVAPGKVAEVAEAPSPAEWPSTAPSFHSGAAAPRLAALASPTPDSSSRGTSEEGSWKKGMASVLAGEAVSLRPLPVEKDVLFGWQALLAKVKGEYPVDAGAAEPRTSSYRRSEWMELNRSRSPGPRNSGEAEPAVEVRDGDTSGVTEIHYHYHISLGAESHPAPALSIASSALRRLERFETAQRAAVVTAWIIGFTALAQASAAVAPMHRRPPEQLRERRGSSDGSVADAAQASHHRSGPEPLTEPDGAPMQETRAPAPARGDSTAPAPASLAPLAVLTSDTLFATVDRALRVHPRVGCPYPFRPGDLLVAIEGRTVLFLEEVATWEAHLDWARYDEQYVTVTRSRPARPGRRSASRAATVRSLDGRRCAVHIKIQPPFLLLP